MTINGKTPNVRQLFPLPVPAVPSVSFGLLLCLGGLSLLAQTIPYTGIGVSLKVQMENQVTYTGETYALAPTNVYMDSAQSFAFDTNASETGWSGNASFSARAAFGALHTRAAGDASSGNQDVYQVTSYAQGHSAFADYLTVLNPHLTNGAPVAVQLTASYYGAVSGLSGSDVNLQSLVAVLASGNGTSLKARIEMYPVTNGVTLTSPIIYSSTNATLNVGDTYQILCSLDAWLDFDTEFLNSASEAAYLTGAIYVDAITPGTSLVSASGHDYSMPPKLTVADSDSALTLTWPASATGFLLQTNGDLTTSDWNAYGGTITTNGGTESVTITPRAGNLFFRLAK